ncbi:hypothetical protein [Tessaracoccus flavescens]|nr:hypothetical protein [Tessaracoccus flavescens]
MSTGPVSGQGPPCRNGWAFTGWLGQVIGQMRVRVGDRCVGF